MNIKTTLLLVLLVGLGVLGWLFNDQNAEPESIRSETLSILEKELTEDNLTGIVIKRKDGVIRLQKEGGNWSLPGDWPVREREVNELVELLAWLDSRFVPIPLKDDNEGRKKQLSQFGLDDPLTVVVETTSDKKYMLHLGQEASEKGRFSRTTYLWLDEKDEIVRLAPGIVAQLDHPQEYYQQRRLFAVQRVPDEDNKDITVEKLDATTISVVGDGSKYTLTKKGDAWEIQKPFKDRPEPDKLKSILDGIPDVWAEEFVEEDVAGPSLVAGTVGRTAAGSVFAAGSLFPGRRMTELGLTDDEVDYVGVGKVLSVRKKKDDITLYVGRVAKRNTRIEMMQMPTQFGPKPKPRFIEETFYYARLKGNPQIFEIKDAGVKNVFVAVSELRDPKIATIENDDVNRIEIEHGKKRILLVKKEITSKETSGEKEKEFEWRLEEPIEQKAEKEQITELLNKFNDLRAEAKEIFEKPKGDHGLSQKDKLTRVSITTEKTEKKDGEEKTTSKTYTFLLGKKEKDKVALQLQGWPRVNLVNEDVLKAAQRSAMVYRNRTILDVDDSDIAAVQIEKKGDSFTLSHDKDEWKLTKPVQVEVDTGAASKLTDKLAKLEVVEFVTDEPNDKDLKALYGLAAPTLKATVEFTDKKKAAKTLLIGSQRKDKEDYFAKFATEETIFVVNKDTFEALSKSSLELRPKEIWRFGFGDLKEIDISQGKKGFQLKKVGDEWTVAEPFKAKALSSAAFSLPFDLNAVNAERFAAHKAKDLKKYGLDSPFAKLKVKGSGKKETHTLLVGDWADKDKKQRYAKLAGEDAVFVIDDKLSNAVATTALDLLDTQLLKIAADEISQVVREGSQAFTLAKKNDQWMVTGSPAPAFTADEGVVDETKAALANLSAVRLEDFGDDVDWKKYGLEKPAVTLSITASDGDAAKKRTLAIGDPVKGDDGSRYARLDQGNGVAVLAAGVLEKINRTYLDFVNRKVLRYPISDVKSIVRKEGKNELELARKDDVWRLVKPVDKLGDILNIEEVLEKTYRLRVKRIAAYPAKDLKKFGLEKPVAVVTLKLQDPFGKATEHIIKIGESAGENDGRYAIVDKGKAVVVLDEKLSEILTASPIHFRDHNLASFSSVDEVILQRRRRKAIFKKQDGEWKMVAPVAASAEDEALGKFIGRLIRLRADKLVADDPKDLKTFELVEPHTSFTFLNNGKEALKLSVGAYETGAKDRQRCYAKIDKNKLVFLLSKVLTEQALAEYRDRKPWESLDAAQVDKLVYKDKDESFTLTKVLDKWHLDGDLKKTIDEKIVTDTLDALASLKVERFIEDQNGNLQLYGLKEPAVLMIEVYTGKDKRVLLIGRPEKDSKRRYVTVEGSKDRPVFVISEGDVSRIVRPVSAFVKKPTEKKNEK